MEPSRTVAELKASFIRSQIRTLSAALEPTEDWRQYGPVPDEGDISDKAIEEALQKLNTIFRQHNRTVYSSQAIRHVARQIETLYWNSVSPENGREDAQRTAIDIGTDLTNSGTIARLPDQWVDNNSSEADKSRYAELFSRLTELDARRQSQQRRLAQYKQLKSLLEPFQDPQNNIQPNLVTRDGELGQELDRMRILVATVSSRIGEGGPRNESKEQQALELADPDKKLAAVLDMT
ncbi:hypothetical protein FQN54_009065 [Arachnomyces sp. PD_36]|nr:hypothetical protein FQN54_009065 [Arachnomyces sp. PD_36]